MTAERDVVISIESIMEILKDYLGEEDMPRDAVARSLMVNPKLENRVAILVESAEWGEELAPIEVRFVNKRVYGL